MLVFAKQKLCILANPKTGTTAIEAALAPRADMVLRNPPNLKHTPAYRYKHLLRPYLDACGVTDLELVCTLREPISWLGSWYRYRQRPYLNGHPNSTRDVSFDDFVDEYCKGKPAAFAKVGRPENFIRRNSGDVIVDHLFQYEQLDLLVAFLVDRLSSDDLSLPTENVSKPGTLTLSEKVEAKLRRKRPGMFDDWNAARR